MTPQIEPNPSLPATTRPPAISPPPEKKPALQHTVQLLSDAEKIAHFGTWDWDLSSDKMTWSDELYRIFGVSREEFTPAFSECMSRIHPEDRERVKESVLRAQKEGSSFSQDERILRPDGSVRYVRTWGHPVSSNGDGIVNRFVCVCQDVTDKYLVEEKSKKTLSLLKTVIESTAEGILVIDHLGTILFSNRRFHELWKIPGALARRGNDDELLQFVLDQLSFPDEFLAKVRFLYDHPKLESFDTIEFKDGRTFERLSRPIPVGEGRDGRIWNFRDVTERNRREKELRESEKRFRKLADATFEGIGIHHEGIIELANRGLCKILGYSHAEMIGSNLLSYVTPEYKELVIGKMAAQATGPYEVVIVKKNGTKIWVEVRARSLPFRRRPARVVSVRDITARKADEEIRERLLEHEKRRRANALFLAEAARILSESLEYETTIRNVAQLATLHFAEWCLLGLLAESRSARFIAAATDAEQRALTAELENYLGKAEVPSGLSTAILGGAPILRAEASGAELEPGSNDWPIFGILDPNYIALLKKLDMRSLIVIPMFIRGRSIGGLMLVSTRENRRYDSTDLDLAVELARLCAAAIDNSILYREAQRSIEVRDDFIAVASHELRTPLTPLTLQLQLLKRHLALTSAPPNETGRTTTLLSGAEQQVSRLTRLVENLLDVSRIRAGRLLLNRTEFDLSALTSEVVRRFNSQIDAAKCTLTLDAPAGVKGYWDRERIDQVVVNLLTNAIKYGAGKAIELRTGQTPKGAILEIKDSGIGIGPEDQAKIFKRFERVAPSHSYGGLGLGLYISRQIVEAHGGTITVQSTLGRGTTFTVNLPLGAPASE